MNRYSKLVMVCLASCFSFSYTMETSKKQKQKSVVMKTIVEKNLKQSSVAFFPGAFKIGGLNFIESPEDLAKLDKNFPKKSVWVSLVADKTPSSFCEKEVTIQIPANFEIKANKDKL